MAIARQLREGNLSAALTPWTRALQFMAGRDPRSPTETAFYRLVEQHCERMEQIYPGRYEDRYGFSGRSSARRFCDSGIRSFESQVLLTGHGLLATDVCSAR